MDIQDIRELGYFSDKDWILILESYLQYIWMNWDEEISIDDLWFHTQLTLGASQQPLEDTDTIELR